MPDANHSFVTWSGATVRVFADAASAALAAADVLIAAIRRGPAVLGLPTGGTPIPVYRCLVAAHREVGLSFRDVTTFNLDEYYPISPVDPNSYRAYMQRHLFAYIDLPVNRAHVLDGTAPEASAASYCAEFDRWIAAAGGLDVQLLGIGRNGHIGFNEPSEHPVEEALTLPTRPVELHPVTIADTAKDFGGEESAVPRRALTMGVASILKAREIVVLATGPAKAEAVAGSLDGPVTARMPGSLLSEVGDRVTWLLDEAAARGLSGKATAR